METAFAEYPQNTTFFGGGGVVKSEIQFDKHGLIRNPLRLQDQRISVMYIH